MSGLLIRDAEADGRRCSVRVRGGRIEELGPALGRAPGEEEIDAAGGVLLPGLTDHHLHLFALAAAVASVRCGPPEVRDRAALRAALHRAAPDRHGWIRGVGYDERVAGALDAAGLDALRADVPVRAQHRSGALWMLNSRAAERVGLRHGRHPGIERDAAGQPTGRVWRADDWLRERLPEPVPPSLAAVGRRLAGYGVTAVTDATPGLTGAAVDLLAEEARSGRLPQRLLLLGAPLGTPPTGRPAPGPWKIVLADSGLPDLALLTEEIDAAHRLGRPVAVHTVTAVSLALLLAALEQTGVLPGDRVEHAAVVPAEALPVVRRLGLRVVTQPGFLADRGDVFLDGTPPGERSGLYRCASFLRDGIPLALSSDAPYGPLDPWSVIRAATTRRVPGGRTANPAERLTAAQALTSYLSPPHSPGAPPPRLGPGLAADLVLLAVPLAKALARPASDLVRLTLVRGRIQYGVGVN
ncbi:amidohydrolase family protein [Streptomyces sp. NPDC086519]|uniref:amidohydrolase family protein n=1 Tax=Streptomyces sp. NPDC086519 TaxID=3154863 RepID=UPI0034187E47